MSCKDRASIYVFDIETTNWVDFLCAASSSLDGKEQEVFGTLTALCQYIEEKGGTWISHYGGGFDNLLVMDRLPKADKVILAGSRILRAQWQSKTRKLENGQRLVFRDSFPWWQTSLAKIGKFLGEPKFQELDASDLGQYDPSLVAAYCQQDVEVLRKGVIETIDFLEERRSFAWTAGSSAVNLLRYYEPDTYALLKQHRIKGDTLDKWLPQRIIRGGRVEVFHYGERPCVYAYDINSSYPTNMCAAPLPFGLKETGSESDEALYKATWFRDGDETPAYVLGEGGRGAGECAAWVTREEMEYLKSDPYYVKGSFDVERILYAEGWSWIGLRFVHSLYSRKKQGCFFSKVFLNSLTGKAGQGWTAPVYVDPCVGCINNCKKCEYGPREYQCIEEAPSKKEGALAAPFQQPLLGAFILGRARIMLTKALAGLAENGWEIYYCDTDSIHTNCPPEHITQFLSLGDNLNEWKVENNGERACYTAPKTYMIGEKKRGKGIDTKALDYSHYLWMADGKYVETDRGGVTKFRSALAHGEDTREQSLVRNVTRVSRGKTILLSGKAVYNW